ncbi:hypothetical protein BDY24DRAFT_445094 [Mrakia frigida]|uniref:uncharacterized protein n=1 Tax=Mrakia frigida TaxID=29902 RepID=UPI003FCC0A09
MASNPRTLLSLPNETLSEILSYVLFEPNGPNRPAALLACSLLREVGIPLLFRYVRVATFASYQSMFGWKGLLIPSEREGKGYGKWVKELELDRLDEQKDAWSSTSKLLDLPSLRTLVLSHRLIESWILDPSGPLALEDSISVPPPNYQSMSQGRLEGLCSQLSSVTTLRYLASPTSTFPHPLSSGLWKGHRRSSTLSLLGIVTYPLLLPLPNLRTIHMVGDLVLDDPRPTENNLVRNVAFSSLDTVQTLIVEFRKDAGSQSRADSMYDCLLRGSKDFEWESRWKGLKRLELRRGEGGEGAKLMEKRFRKSWETAGKAGGRGRTSSEKRLGALVVFVDEDGTERRLVD